MSSMIAKFKWREKGSKEKKVEDILDFLGTNYTPNSKSLWSLEISKRWNWIEAFSNFLFFFSLSNSLSN